MFAKMTVVVVDENTTPDPNTGHTFHTHRWRRLQAKLQILKRGAEYTL